MTRPSDRPADRKAGFSICLVAAALLLSPGGTVLGDDRLPAPDPVLARRASASEPRVPLELFETGTIAPLISGRLLAIDGLFAGRWMEIDEGGVGRVPARLSGREPSSGNDAAASGNTGSVSHAASPNVIWYVDDRGRLCIEGHRDAKCGLVMRQGDQLLFSADRYNFAAMSIAELPREEGWGWFSGFRIRPADTAPLGRAPVGRDQVGRDQVGREQVEQDPSGRDG